MEGWEGERATQVARSQTEAKLVLLAQAYHAGFSHGANTAEAVNFMLLDWLPYARIANARYRAMAREPVLDLEQILMRAAADNHSPEVMEHLRSYVDEELEQRAVLRKKGCAERMLDRKDMAAALGRGPPCMACGHVCHMSFVMIGATPRAARSSKPRGQAHSVETHLVCLRHVADLPVEGSDEEVTMHLRYNDEFLSQVARRHEDDDRPPSSTLPLPVGAERAARGRSGSKGEKRARASSK